MSTDREVVIPVAPVDPIEARLAQLGRWIEGYTDDEGKRHPGLLEMVGKLYEELETRRERREAILRGLTIGGIVTLLGGSFAWLKDHLK